VHVVLTGTSVSFRVKAPLHVDQFQPTDFNFRNWTIERATAAWERVLAPMPPSARARLDAGLAFLLHDMGEIDAACEQVRALPHDARSDKKWQHLADQGMAARYRPLFVTRGVHFVDPPPKAPRPPKPQPTIIDRARAKLARIIRGAPSAKK